MAAPEGANRDWYVSVLLPTLELRDALITDVAHSVQALTEPPSLAVRMIRVVDDAEQPTLTVHIRSKAPISRQQAKAAMRETLHRYAPGLDLSAVTVSVTGQPPKNEPRTD